MIFKQKGTIALISLLVISAVVLAIGISVSLTGLDEMKMGFRQGQTTGAFYVAESCMEEALFRLKQDENYSGGALSIGDGSCNIDITANGSQRTITVTGTLNQYTRGIQAIVNILNDGTTYGNEVISWEEAY